MRVDLLGAVQWEDLIAETLSSAQRVEERDLRALLHVFHARHIGITPSIAAEMRGAFAARRLGGNKDQLRTQIYTRLLDALGIAPTARRDPRQFDFLDWHVIVDLLLLPLGGLAVERIGITVLFSPDPALRNERADNYAGYEADLRVALKAICTPSRQPGGSGRADALDLFWERTAHQLWAEVRRRQGGAGPGKAGWIAASRLDSVGLRLLCGLSPEVEIDEDTSRLRLEPSDEQNPLLTRPKQGGVIGIHHTSRVDDVDEMLLTEMMLPPALLADKLLNSSYMARHRPPPFDERRQLLVLGCALDAPNSTPVAFAKMAWLDALFRFAILLYQHGLHRSELRFAQFVAEAGASMVRAAVGDYRQFDGQRAAAATRQHTRRFFCDAGWLPGFVAGLPALGLGAAIDTGPDTRERRLVGLLSLLAPERGGGARSEAVDFRLAMAVVITAQQQLAQPLLLPRRSGFDPLPLHSIRLDCPDELRPGQEFLIVRDIDDDGSASRAPRKVVVGGDADGAATRADLELASAQLSRQIFDFYWSGIDG